MYCVHTEINSEIYTCMYVCTYVCVYDINLYTQYLKNLFFTYIFRKGTEDFEKKKFNFKMTCY